MKRRPELSPLELALAAGWVLFALLVLACVHAHVLGFRLPGM